METLLWRYDSKWYDQEEGIIQVKLDGTPGQ